MPKEETYRLIGKQLFRSGTSVGAQYREAHRAKSKPDMISKLEGCLQELEETEYWFEILIEANLFEKSVVLPFINEAEELKAIFIASVRTLKSK